MPAAPKKGRAGKARPFSQSASPSANPPKGGALWRNIRAILLPLALFLFIRTFLIEAYRIPSGSMIPALLVGDWLFVNKLRFGPHVPFTEKRLPGYAEPKRGDIVIFASPRQLDQPQDPTPTLVKRAVAQGGDTIHMRNALLHVNGVPVRGYAPDPADAHDSVDPLFEWQHRAELKTSRFGPVPAEPSHDNWGPLLVPPAHFFMMGDNRYNSKDSRYWGFVPRNNIRGRPLFVYYSYNADDSDRPVPFITDIRWGRIGDWIR